MPQGIETNIAGVIPSWNSDQGRIWRVGRSATDALLRILPEHSLTLGNTVVMSLKEFQRRWQFKGIASLDKMAREWDMGLGRLADQRGFIFDGRNVFVPKWVKGEPETIARQLVYVEDEGTISLDSRWENPDFHPLISLDVWHDQVLPALKEKYTGIGFVNAMVAVQYAAGNALERIRNKAFGWPDKPDDQSWPKKGKGDIYVGLDHTDLRVSRTILMVTGCSEEGNHGRSIIETVRGAEPDWQKPGKLDHFFTHYEKGDPRDYLTTLAQTALAQTLENYDALCPGAPDMFTGARQTPINRNMLLVWSTNLGLDIYDLGQYISYAGQNKQDVQDALFCQAEYMWPPGGMSPQNTVFNNGAYVISTVLGKGDRITELFHSDLDLATLIGQHEYFHVKNYLATLFRLGRIACAYELINFVSLLIDYKVKIINEQIAQGKYPETRNDYLVSRSEVLDFIRVRYGNSTAEDCATDDKSADKKLTPYSDLPSLN